MAGGKRRSIPPLNPAVEKPLIALQSALSGDALIKAVFALLKRGVRCEFVNVCLRIVRRGDRDIVYRMIDSRGRTFGLDLLEGSFFESHPGMPILLANPGIKFINTREVLPADEILHKMPFYRDVMQVIGFRHSIGMFFWEDPPTIPEAIFGLFRREGQPDFDDEEVAVLDRLHPHIDAALGRLRKIDRERAARDGLRSLAQRVSRAVCILYWDLSVAQANRAALEMCARWNLGPASARLKPPPFQLPGALRKACAELKARWRASLRHNPVIGAAGEIAVHHPNMLSLRATVSLRVYRSDPLSKPRFVITFEPEGVAPSPASRSSRNSGVASLAPHERDLVRLVAAGLSNQEIATETGRALGSVKNALHAVFRKVDVRSRSALIAQTLAQSP